MIFIRILDPLAFVNLVKYFLKTSETLQTILLHTMIPLVTFVAGGIIATYKQPGKALEASPAFCRRCDYWMELVLSFGLSALLYLVTEELLVEAHSEEDKPIYTEAFFTWFPYFLDFGNGGLMKTKCFHEKPSNIFEELTILFRNLKNDLQLTKI